MIKRGICQQSDFRTPDLQDLGLIVCFPMLHSKSISNMIFFLFHINFLTCGVHIWMFRIVPGTWQIHSKHLLNEWIGLPLLGGSLLVYVLNMASWLNQKCKSPTVFFFPLKKCGKVFLCSLCGSEKVPEHLIDYEWRKCLGNFGEQHWGKDR